MMVVGVGYIVCLVLSFIGLAATAYAPVPYRSVVLNLHARDKRKKEERGKKKGRKCLLLTKRAGKAVV